MLKSVVAMRDLIARPLWWAQVASMSTDEDGDVSVDDILAVAAYSVTDDVEALEISMEVQEAVENLTSSAYVVNGPQELTLALLDWVINKYSRMN